MSKIVYLNGEFTPQEDARISVFDRGFLFGDGVYEVIPVLNGRLVDTDYSVERLTRSLAATRMDWPCSVDAYLAVLRELISRNRLVEGSVYVQVTRGVAERDFGFPKNTPVTMMAYTTERKLLDNPLAETGVAVVSVPDWRWQRRDIKSLNLLAQCMAKQQAVENGAFEAWMLEDGLVTEGSSSSAFIVKDGRIIARSLTRAILPGIRRRVILEAAERNNWEVELRAFSLAEACAADEAFLTSATTLVLPVVRIDGEPVNDGRPGPIAQRLRAHYIERLKDEAGGAQ